MPDLTDTQLDMLVDVVKHHETHGASYRIGPRRAERIAAAEAGQDGGQVVAQIVESEDHATARALARAGMVEWHPKPRPFSRTAFARIGKRWSTIARHVDEATRIVPTPKGRDHVAEHLKRSEAARKGARTRRKRAS